MTVPAPGNAIGGAISAEGGWQPPINREAGLTHPDWRSRLIISGRGETILKKLALILGIASVVAVVLDLYPLTMFLSLPFCLIWSYCGWLHNEPQLKWVNILFMCLYAYGIMRYFLMRDPSQAGV